RPACMGGGGATTRRRQRTGRLVRGALVTDSPAVQQDTKRTYVLDTSVLLSDPWACSRLAEPEVEVSLVVIMNLEHNRHNHEPGWFARQALRLFDDLRLEHGRLDQPI